MNKPTLKGNRHALVLGAGGFIGHHMVKRLKSEGYTVSAADLKKPEFSPSQADNFYVCDLSNRSEVLKLMSEIPLPLDEIYQFAADMGGAGYIFSGENDANVMTNSALINLNVLSTMLSLSDSWTTLPKIFYSSSACIYPQEIQTDSKNVDLREAYAYPANPDSEYGWEKLFSERLYSSYSRNFGFEVRVARFHNVYGPEGTWTGGKEKAPAAICRKVATAENGKTIEIWGDGNQTRSFLYIDDCIEAVRRFMIQNDHQGPINIGSEEMVSIRELVQVASSYAGKSLEISSVEGPVGVRGRNSNNQLMRRVLDWDYEVSIRDGIAKTYDWIRSQLEK